MKDLHKEMFAKYLETYHFQGICIQSLFSELIIADFMLIQIRKWEGMKKIFYSKYA